MIKYLYTLVSDFVILIIAAIALFFFKSPIIQEGVWLYELAWVVIIIATIGTILLKPRKPKVTPVFPRELAKRVENALPHDAIKLYQSWLLMSLDKCYQILQKQRSKEALSDLANALADKLIFVFNRMPRDCLYKILEERNKDNAFVALIFFTTVIESLKPYAVKSLFKKPLSAYRDVFTHITLENAPDYLFREHYRLYELGALVEGRWLSLNFNSDLEPLLRSALAPQLLEDKSQPKAPTPKKPSVNEINEISDTESKKTLSQSQEDSTAEQTGKPPAVVKETVVEDESKKTINTDNIETEQCEKFFKWLQRQIDRKPINCSEYFYQDCKQQGDSMLFITDIALSDFSKKTQISANVIKEALVLQKHSDGKPYQFKEEGQPDKQLLSINVNFEIKTSSELSGSIEEGL